MAEAATNWAEKRRFERITLKTSVSFVSDTNFYTGFADNISEGGIFIATYHVAPMGSTISLEFSLPDDGPPIKLVGEVRWIAEYNPSSEGHPGLGLRFTELEASDRLRIEAFCRQRGTLFYDDE